MQHPGGARFPTSSLNQSECARVSSLRKTTYSPRRRGRPLIIARREADVGLVSDDARARETLLRLVSWILL